MDFQEFILKLVISLFLGAIYTLIFCYVRDWNMSWLWIFGLATISIFGVANEEDHNFATNIFYVIALFISLLLVEHIFF